MSSSLIKPLLDSSYQVCGINFKNRNINIFTNNSFDVRFSGTVEYYKNGMWNSDLWLNKRGVTIYIPNLFKSKTQFTVIYKYSPYSYTGGYFIPNRALGGFEPNLYASGGEFGLFNRGTWFRDGSPFGHLYKNGPYELAIESTQSRFRIWLNGNLQRVYNRSWILDTTFNFGDPKHNLQLRVNDILITDALFLPNKYTVDWKNTWYEMYHNPIYKHDEELFLIPK